jgi:kinesin family protein 11
MSTAAVKKVAAASKVDDTTKENVQVLLRCRPLNPREAEDKQTTVVHIDEKRKEVAVSMKAKAKNFYFDNVFGPTSTQRDIYNAGVSPIVEEVLKGYNCTIFAYGQTGTGKTYTMEGLSSGTNPELRWKNNHHAGIITRAVNHIFDELEKTGSDYCVKVSHLELYNEELFDLLNPGNANLKLYDAPGTQGVTVAGLEEVVVYAPQDIFTVLERSCEERRSAETKLNKNSSRSHCIFSITLHIKETNPEGEDLLKVGKLNLVDLAGSENIGRSGADAKAERKAEAGMINKSLLTLGRVITALTDNSPHIPYRESKLTRLLQDSLGGTTKTCIIATVSPASGSIEESLSTLEYANRAKNIKNKPEANAKMTKREMIKEYSVELRELRQQLEAMRYKIGVYLPTETYNKLQEELTEFKEKEIILSEKIEMKEKELAEVQELFERQTRELTQTTKKYEETKTTLVKTSEELKVTQEELGATKEDLVEHKHVVSEHERVETQFHKEANVLLGTISTTVTDISGLFSKIDRKDQLEVKNSSKVDDFRQVLLDRAHETEHRLKEFVSNQTSQYEDLKDSIANFVERKNNEIQSLQSRIEDLQRLVSSTQSSLGNIVQGYQDQTETKIAQVRHQQKQHDFNIKHTVEEFNTTAKQLFEELNASLKNQQAEMTKWTESRQGDMAASQQLVKQFAEQQQTFWNNAKSMVDTQYTSQVSRLDAHRNELQTLEAEQKKKTEELRGEMMKTFSSMLEQFVQGQDKALTRTFSTIDSSLQTSAGEWKNYAGELNNVATSALRDISESSKAIGGGQTSFVDQISENSRRVESAITSTGGRIDELQKQLVRHNQEVTDLTRVSRSETEEKANSMENDVKQFALAHNEQLSMMEIEGQDLKRDLASNLDETKKSFAQAAERWAEDLSATQESTQQFKSEYTSVSQNVQREVKSFNLISYAPTGTTPMKRDFSYPKQLARSKPKDVVINEYRKQKQGLASEEQPSEEISPVEPASPVTEVEQVQSPAPRVEEKDSIVLSASTPSIPLNQSSSQIQAAPLAVSQENIPVTKKAAPAATTKATAAGKKTSTVSAAQSKKENLSAVGKKVVTKPATTKGKLQEITNTCK